MKRLTLYTVCCLVIALSSCMGKPDEKITEVRNGAFKVLIRSQEFHHSGIVNVDLCVANASTLFLIVKPSAS
jgi:hypothetical protein